MRHFLNKIKGHFMEKANSTISPVFKKRLYIQGYQNYSDKELNDYKYGIRFAYALCTTLAGLGLVFNSIPLLIVAAAVALASTMLPYHPFDYLYNYVVRHLFSKPRIPHRTAQGRFACDVAFVWLTTIILFFYNGHFITGKILGGILVTMGALVSTMDICIPSMVYNLFFRKTKQ